MKVVLATGGTGGHLFPAFKVASVLRQRKDRVIFFGSFRIGLEKINHDGYEVIEHFAKGLDRSNIFIFAWTGLTIFLSIFFAYWKLKKLAPDIVVGFGGYGAYPVVRAACWLGIPSMIHEQNVVPGAANLKLMCHVDSIAVSFKESEKYFPKTKARWAGLPVKVSSLPNRQQSYRYFSFDPQKKTLLVMGGSQGSERIDNIIMEALRNFPHKENIQVIHLCGQASYEMLKIKYKEMGIPFALYRFLDKIEEAYAVADLVVARAGASTVAELGLFGKRSILIPYRFAGGHQIDNAKILESLGLAEVLDENNLDSEKLKNILVSAFLTGLSENSSSRKQNIFTDQAEKNIITMMDHLVYEK